MDHSVIYGQLDGDVMVTNNSSNIYTQTITLTNAQIKNLHITPIVLVPAQGAGTVVLPMNIISKLNYGGNDPFTGADGIFLISSSYIICSAAIVEDTQDSFYLSVFNNFELPANLFENVDLTLLSDTPIGGNASNDNTMSFYIQYVIVKI